MIRNIWIPFATTLVAAATAACARAEAVPEPRAAAAPSVAAIDGPRPSTEVPASRGVAPARSNGLATWYGAAFAGRRTASGERFDPRKMTAAHRTLPFDTWVEVTRPDTGDRVRVRITDRGPFGHSERIIDLSQAAAAKLHMLKRGPTRVEVRVVAGP